MLTNPCHVIVQLCRSLGGGKFSDQSSLSPADQPRSAGAAPRQLTAARLRPGSRIHTYILEIYTRICLRIRESACVSDFCDLIVVFVFKPLVLRVRVRRVRVAVVIRFVVAGVWRHGGRAARVTVGSFFYRLGEEQFHLKQKKKQSVSLEVACLLLTNLAAHAFKLQMASSGALPLIAHRCASNEFTRQQKSSSWSLQAGFVRLFFLKNKTIRIFAQRRRRQRRRHQRRRRQRRRRSAAYLEVRGEVPVGLVLVGLVQVVLGQREDQVVSVVGFASRRHRGLRRPVKQLPGCPRAAVLHPLRDFLRTRDEEGVDPEMKHLLLQ